MPAQPLPGHPIALRRVDCSPHRLHPLRHCRFSFFFPAFPSLVFTGHLPRSSLIYNEPSPSALRFSLLTWRLPPSALLVRRKETAISAADSAGSRMAVLCLQRMSTPFRFFGRIVDVYARIIAPHDRLGSGRKLRLGARSFSFLCYHFLRHGLLRHGRSRIHSRLLHTSRQLRLAGVQPHSPCHIEEILNPRPEVENTSRRTRMQLGSCAVTEATTEILLSAEEASQSATSTNHRRHQIPRLKHPDPHQRSSHSAPPGTLSATVTSARARRQSKLFSQTASSLMKPRHASSPSPRQNQNRGNLTLSGRSQRHRNTISGPGDY